MLYYSMQVLWPRQSSLLFASANQPILRGVYANLTLWGTWCKFTSHLLLHLLTPSSITNFCMGGVCTDRARKVADHVLHLCTDDSHRLPVIRRGRSEEQSHRIGVYHVLLHKPSTIFAIRHGFAESRRPKRYVSLPTY